MKKFCVISIIFLILFFACLSGNVSSVKAGGVQDTSTPNPTRTHVPTSIFTPNYPATKSAYLATIRAITVMPTDYGYGKFTATPRPTIKIDPYPNPVNTITSYPGPVIGNNRY
jgi:hypothetical protein